jgi:hypothetical protein
MLRGSPDESFRVEVVDVLIVEFLMQEERWSSRERPRARVYDLILGPPSGWAWLTDRL